MSSLLLPDSNFFIGQARKGIDPFVTLASRADDWEFLTCGIVVVEVTRGRSNPFIVQRFRERFAVMHHVGIGESVWERVGKLAWSLDRCGDVLPLPDLIIAACALQVDATVLTEDFHFSLVPGLRVLDRL